jgi:hypothetical protein
MFIYLVIFYDKISRHLMDQVKVIYYLFSYIYLLTYVFTLWSTILLEKLTDSQQIKKFSVYYGNRRFITAFTSARHLSLS